MSDDVELRKITSLTLLQDKETPRNQIGQRSDTFSFHLTMKTVSFSDYGPSNNAVQNVVCYVFTYYSFAPCNCMICKVFRETVMYDCLIQTYTGLLWLSIHLLRFVLAFNC